jgi:hypothetical protein
VVLGGTEMLRGSPEWNRSFIQLLASFVAGIDGGIIIIAMILLKSAE